MALVSSSGWLPPEGDAPASRGRSRVLILVGRQARPREALVAGKEIGTTRAGRFLIGGVGASFGLSLAHHLSSASSSASAAVGSASATLASLGAALLSNDVLLDGACGGIAYGATDMAYGVDTLKVRMQTGAKLFDGGVLSSMKSLYEGVGVSAAFRFLHGALYMPVYGEMKHALLAAQAPLASAVVASATAATVLVSLVEVPVEALLLRVKSGRAASGFLSAAKSALSSPGGIASLYCGAGPFIARHVLYESLEFLAYETLRARALAKKRLAGPLHAGDGSHSAGLAPSEAAVMAFAAATVATVASQPLDCIRVACSLSAGGAAHAHAAHAAASGGLTAVGALQSIIRAKGPAGLFSGLLPRLATLAPGAVIFFSTYEATRAASLRIRGGLAASSGAAPAHAGVAEEAPVAAGPTNVMSSATTVDAVASEALAVAAGHSVAAEPVLALACAAKQTTRR